MRLILLITQYFHLEGSVVESAEHRIFEFLQSNYTSNMRPVDHPNDSIEIELDMEIESISKVLSDYTHEKLKRLGFVDYIGPNV